VGGNLLGKGVKGVPIGKDSSSKTEPGPWIERLFNGLKVSISGNWRKATEKPGDATNRIENGFHSGTNLILHIRCDHIGKKR